MKSAIILDLDGVICDTAHFHFLAWHRLAAEYGYELTHADNEQLKGVSRADSLTFILGLANKTLSPEQFQEDLHRKNEWYLELVKDMGPLDVLPGVPSFFAEVAARKIPLALGSASKNANMVLTRWIDSCFQCDCGRLSGHPWQTASRNILESSGFVGYRPRKMPRF
jgi:beta-phosphoglucomutase